MFRFEVKHFETCGLEINTRLKEIEFSVRLDRDLSPAARKLKEAERTEAARIIRVYKLLGYQEATEKAREYLKLPAAESQALHDQQEIIDNQIYDILDGIETE